MAQALYHPPVYPMGFENLQSQGLDWLSQAGSPVFWFEH